MKILFLFLFIPCILVCQLSFGQTSLDTFILKSNTELIQLYEEDQADRKNRPIDWVAITKKDSLRKLRVYELLDSNKVQTSLDYKNAAMIFQHGRDSLSFGMAVKMMRKSVALDSNASKWLLAAAIDRYLLSKGEAQIYGTQFKKYGKDNPWFICEMDTTKVSDEERIAYGVETLAQQRVKLRKMNLKKISELYFQDKSLDDIINLIKTEYTTQSDYDLSEDAINSFAYQLLGEDKKEEALRFFKLNTELYPDAFNTFDSYGECLWLLGKKSEALLAYQKSLELNPNNSNAKNILERLK